MLDILSMKTINVYLNADFNERRFTLSISRKNPILSNWLTCECLLWKCACGPCHAHTFSRWSAHHHTLRKIKPQQRPIVHASKCDISWSSSIAISSSNRKREFQEFVVEDFDSTQPCMVLHRTQALVFVCMHIDTMLPHRSMKTTGKRHEVYSHASPNSSLPI